MTLGKLFAAPAVCSLLLGVCGAGIVGNAEASSILILTGNGASSLNAPLTGAGFTVINGTLAPGEISGKLAADTVGVYIWNDGSLGNTFSPVIPALAFNAADQAALTAFGATHRNFILDGLSWRGNLNIDEQRFSQNEAVQLAAAGGGVVLGADDASGALIVQHVNQVADWFNLNRFTGIYNTAPAKHVFGGSFLNSPNSVDPTNVVGTTSYAEVPHGLQPNGVFLATAVFGFDSEPQPFYGPSPDLASETFAGVTYASVNHLVTTNIKGGGIDPIPEPATLLTFAAGLLALATSRLRRG